MSIYAYSLATFAAAALLGIAFYRSAAWQLVDVVYYPLAAVGVALLFVSNATQRNLLLLDEQLERNKSALKALETSKPGVNGTPTTALVDASFSLISGIGELAAVCQRVPSMDPNCTVAQKMNSAVAEFTSIANAKYESPELRLAAACRAAEDLVAKLRTDEHMSSLVGEELASQIKDARTRQHYYLDYTATEREAQMFERRATARLTSLRRSIADTSEAMTFVFSVNEAEVKTGKTIIHALYPCLVVPQNSLDQLAHWTVNRQSHEAALARLEEERKRVQSKPALSRTGQWMQLNLWPFVLIAALSFKFSKGVATLKKHRMETRTKQTNGQQNQQVCLEDAAQEIEPDGPANAVEQAITASSAEPESKASSGANVQRDDA